MIWPLLFPVLVMLPVAVLVHLLPVMRSETYFAVHVSPGFRESPEGAAILTRYRITNGILFTLGTSLMQWAVFSRTPWALIPGPLLHSFGMMAATQRARKQAWAHREPPADSTRVATLTHEELLPSWTLPLWALPALILGGTAWYLSLHWSSLPDSFPVHWGLDGLPNRWMTKSVKGVYGVLLIGASIMLLLYVTLVAIVFGARRSPGEIRMMRAASASLLGIMASVSLLLAAIALHPLSAQPNQMSIPMPVVLMLPLVLLAISLIPMWRARSEVTERGDRTPDECWRMGNYYFNPDDPALMVRNRIGLGYSPNFAHPVMKVAVPLMVAQLLLVVVYVAT